MKDFLLRNKVILGMFALWYLVGSISTPLFFVVGTASLLLLWRRAFYFEILLGFFFILILSDNLKTVTDFAKVFKNLYIVFLAAIALLDRQRFSNNRIYFYFIPFLVIAMIGLFYSPHPFTAFQKTLSYLLLLFAVPRFTVRALEDKGPNGISDFVYMGVLMIVIGYLLRFIDPSVAYSHGGRFRAIFGNPNGLGIFTILLFAFAMVCRDYFPGKFGKWNLRWIFFPILIAVVLSGSRSAVIGITLFFIFSRFYRYSPFIGFVAFLTIGFAVEILLSNLVPIILSLGLGDFFRIDSLDDGSGRFIAWEFAWAAIQEHFWIGRGFAFDEWLMGRSQDVLNDLGHQGGVHNTYLIIWLNAGIIGLLFFLRALVLLFIRGAKNSNLAFPLLWMVLFSNMLEPWLAASLNPFTIILIMSITVITDPVFQPYLRGELSSIQKPYAKALAA